MTIQLEMFVVRTRFIFVKNLAVLCILETGYNGRYVRTIRFIDWKVELLDGSSVSIHTVHGKDEMGDFPPARYPRQACHAPSKIRVAKSQRMASAEAEVWVQIGVGGLSFLQNLPEAHLN